MEKLPENLLKTYNFRAVLSWYGEMGIDTAIGEQPINWLESAKTIDQSLIARARKKAKPRADQSPAKAFLNSQKQQNNTANDQTGDRKEQRKSLLPNSDQQRSVAPPPKTAPLTIPSLELAKQLASQGTSLTDLKNALESFDGCGLKRTAKNLVFSRGAETAKLMIIGEAPGRDEDIVGKPFVGRAGELLDKMLAAIKLEESQVHITNIVYWRPPGNRTPSAEEGLICRPFLNRQIELVAPELILFLGGAAAKQIYETQTGITKLRGKWKQLEIDGKSYQTMATLHPAYLLRTPIAKRLVWQDLQKIQSSLQ
ncbi:MAG: uracil-DNA glycosylase [Rhodomicrobium sp.]|nr:MAG: uracil-DNA glycosylase [Rhodomicrobium sp.]